MLTGAWYYERVRPFVRLVEGRPSCTAALRGLGHACRGPGQSSDSCEMQADGEIGEK